MSIDNVSFSINVSFNNGRELVLKNFDNVEFDYGGSHYCGIITSIRENMKLSDSDNNFILYVYGTAGSDEKQRLYDVPMWSIENLKLWSLD